MKKELKVSFTTLHISKPWVHERKIYQKYLVLINIGKNEFLREFIVPLQGGGPETAPPEGAED